MCQDPEAGKSLVHLRNRKKASVVVMSGMREVRRHQGCGQDQGEQRWARSRGKAPSHKDEEV